MTELATTTTNGVISLGAGESQVLTVTTNEATSVHLFVDDGTGATIEYDLSIAAYAGAFGDYQPVESAAGLTDGYRSIAAVPPELQVTITRPSGLSGAGDYRVRVVATT